MRSQSIYPFGRTEDPQWHFTIRSDIFTFRWLQVSAWVQEHGIRVSISQKPVVENHHPAFTLRFRGKFAISALNSQLSLDLVTPAVTLWHVNGSN